MNSVTLLRRIQRFFYFSQHYNERLPGYSEMNFNRNILLKIIYPVAGEVINKPCLRHDCDHKSFNHHWQRSCKTGYWTLIFMLIWGRCLNACEPFQDMIWKYMKSFLINFKSVLKVWNLQASEIYFSKVAEIWTPVALLGKVSYRVKCLWIVWKVSI